MDFRNIIGHEDIIKHFKSSIETDHVNHAYILCGEKASGKRSVAQAFAKTLQCEKGGIDACCMCQSCLQADSGNHPDIVYVKHEKATGYSVDEIREQVVSTVPVRPYKSKYKVYIIEDAQLMNPACQNALLKTIEEPPQYAVLLLLTNSMDRILPTIVSRCILLNMKPVRERDILEYLEREHGVTGERAVFCAEYAEGNLGKAVLLATNEDYAALIESVIDLESHIFEMDMDSISDAIKNCSEKYKMNIEEYLDLMMMWYRDILMLKVTGKPDKIIFKDELSTIRNQSKYLSFNRLEKNAKAIETAKIRLRANAKFEDVMRLLILTLKEHEREEL